MFLSLLLSLLFSETLCTFNEAMIPSVPGYKIISSSMLLEESNITVSSNHSVQINSTDMDPSCTPECYLNCQYHFQNLVEMKYCIINVCKCQIISEQPSTSSIKQVPEPTKSNSNITTKFIKKEILGGFIEEDRETSYLSAGLYAIIIIFSLYELFAFNFIFKQEKSRKSEYKELEDPNLYQKLINDEKEEEY